MPRSLWLFALAVSSLITSALSPSQIQKATSGSKKEHAIQVKEDDAVKHLKGDWPDVRLAPSESARYRPFDGLRFSVTVNDQGNVIDVASESAADAEVPPPGFDQGQTIAFALKFEPFTRDGRYVSAHFSFYIPVFPPEKLPTERVAFPNLVDRKSLVMTLERWGCYGTCPTYRIDVHGDGEVDYEGKCFVAVVGRRSSTIADDAVQSLFELFRNADYFSLQGEYESPATDLPTFKTSISFDGHWKSILDYYGVEMGMPDAVKRIERELDRATNSSQWLNKGGRWKPSKRKPCG